jgi:hypothetical protein
VPLVLAVEPDLRQGEILTRVIREKVRADLVLVESRDAALSALAGRTPDVVLLTALLSPRDEDELLGHLRRMPNSGHIQTHTIPQLASGEVTRPVESGGGLLGKLRKKKKKADEAPMAGCDPALFASEVRSYIERAEELKQDVKADAALAPIRADERLIESVTGGIVVETGAAAVPTPAASAWSSPFEWRRSEPLHRVEPEPLEQETEPAAAPHAGEEALRTIQAEAQARAAAEEAEATAERERVEAEAAAKRERQRLEADAAAKRERQRVEAEAATERERQRLEAEAAAKRERQRLEAEAAAKRERQRLEAEAAAERERQRLEAEAAAERERLRLEAEAAAKRERQRLEAEAAAKRERQRLEAEAAAERERQRLEAEAAAKRERQRLEAEAAAERERQRLEAEAAAERERQRLEAEAAAEREREHLEEELQRATAALEASQLERDTDVEIEIDLDADVTGQAEADDFAAFREGHDELVAGILTRIPVTAWARVDAPPAAPPPDVDFTDDFGELLARLMLPEGVAAVRYAEGCRIRRVRVPAASKAPARTKGPVILSRRALDELRQS